MARGTYYKCNVCGHTEFSEICSLECANAVLEDVENDKDKAEEEV